MPQYTVNLAGGGQVVVNASDPAAAVENAGGPSGSYVTAGGYTGGAGQPTGTTAPSTPTTVNNQGGEQLASGINSLLGAIASGNKQAFDEAVRQFNVTFGLDTRKFEEAVRQFNANLGVTEAGLTGAYQGAPTMATRLAEAGLTGYYTPPGSMLGSGNIAMDAFAKAGGPDQQNYLQATGGDRNAAAQRYWQDVQGAIAGSGQTPQQFVYGAGAGAPAPTMAREQQTYAQQMGMINTAAALQANPFRQQQAIGQMGRLLGGQGVAGFSAPNTVAGVGTAGGNTQGGLGYLQQMVDDIRDPTANTQSMNQILQGIPTPNKVNSVEFMRAAPSTQNMVLQGMQEKYGLDPTDALTQIKNTLPGFQAPTSSFGGIKR